MKILVCIPCLLTGGTEIQTLSLVRALLSAGHTVSVACYFEHSAPMVARYRSTGANVHLLSANGSRPSGVKATSSHLWHGLKHIVKAEKPDVAHVQYMAPGAIPIIILRILGVKRIIATAHTAADIYSPNGLRLISILNNHILTAFQCITERAERSFFGSSQLFTPAMSLKKHGNHFTIYNNLPSYITLRESPRSFDPNGRLTIGVVSRLERIKGMDLVVPAFASVKQDFPEIRLFIVGDGSLRESMEQQARQAGVQDSVTFAGRQPQEKLQTFYDSIDILLMPSRSEGFGLTAVEGMARGCVVVAANTGGLPEVVRDGTDGLLHEPGSATHIADSVRKLLKDTTDIGRLSDNARRRTECFSTERYNALTAQLYNTL